MDSVTRIPASGVSMCKTHHLGLANEIVPCGSHICQIYTDTSEAIDSLRKYVRSGAAAGECVACFSDRVTDSDLEEALLGTGITLVERKGAGYLSVSRVREVYFQNETFDPQRMLGLLSSFHEDALAKGVDCRVIGEMSPEIGRVEGGGRLLEYESRVSMLLREHPVTAVCQYNANDFDGAMIMDVLKVHPQMIVNGAVVHNPYFIPPEEFLGRS